MVLLVSHRLGAVRGRGAGHGISGQAGHARKRRRGRGLARGPGPRVAGDETLGMGRRRQDALTGGAVRVVTTGTRVQVFLLARGVPAGAWSGNESGVPS